ncbi:MAG: hypothetical protein VYB17_04535 [Candidatus Thermoplasmatota archaeon]|nr:hypothetical protein [Candidatus Thermoplasmatota archaeon]
MVEAPSNSILLSETEIADSWIDAKRVWMQGAFYFALIAITFSIIAELSLIQWSQAILIIAIFSIGILTMSSRKISIARNQLDVIAISAGHPWHDSDGVGHTTVYVHSQGEWVGLGANVRIVTTRDPLLDLILLRDGDSEGKILARWSGEIEPRVVAMINMAQALANAQDRGDEHADSFEAAREREETAEGLLEREWMDTEEGAVDYEPGAILRVFKRSFDGDSGDEEQTQDND